MDHKQLLTQTDKAVKQRNLAILVSGVLLVSNLLLATSLIMSDKSIILIPNSLDKDTALTSNRMSPAYAEMLTRDVVNTMFNVTPSNTKYASESILRITHPKFYGELKNALTKRAEDVINRKLTVSFYPQSFSISEDAKTVFVVGKLLTYLGKEQVLEEEKTYSVTYSFDNFRPMILDFHEVIEEIKKDGGKA